MRSALALLAIVAAAGCGEKPPIQTSAPGGDDWHKKVVFYELWVRSFQDSDGDGIGDFEGLTSRLDHLAELGVGAIWLMPIHPSPLVDSGYDVADYLAIHPDYGTMEQFRRFVDEAHRRRIKVFLDLVVNHTSNAHGWFEESRGDRAGPKADFYLWADSPAGNCDESNFIFGQQRWTLDARRGQYYFHQFFPQQPDLNFRSPALREAVLDVMRFWLDLGVDGYRADVPHQYVENWPKCWHQPETFAFHREMRAVLDAVPARAMVGEVCCERDEVLRYLGSGNDAFHLVFYFVGMRATWAAVKYGGAAGLAEAISYAVANSPPGGLHANTLGNHDIFRTPTTIEDSPAALKLAATAQLTLPGAPFVYYGEEIGMTDGTEYKVDVRDYARTPMQWDPSPLAGFTTGTPWLALSPSVRRANVEDQRSREDSILSHYRRLISLRNRTPALHEGGFEIVGAGHPAVLAFLRTHPTGDRLVVLNFDREASAAVTVSLPPDWASPAYSVDELSGETVGSFAGQSWSATLLPRFGGVFAPFMRR